MPEIILDVPTHKYTVDGRVVPMSVTELLHWAGLVDSTWWTEWGRQRGKLTHLALHYFNCGILDEPSLDPALQGYFQAYIKFLVDSGFVCTGSEIPVYNEEYSYAGTIDLEGYFKWNPNILYIGDAKTNKVHDWTGHQVSLYRFARGGYRRGFALELHQNGGYRIKWYDRSNQPRYDREAREILKRWREKD